MTLRKFMLRTIILQNKYRNYVPVVWSSTRSYEDDNDKRDRYKKYGGAAAAALLGSVLIGTAIRETMDSKKVNTVKVHKIENLKLEAGGMRPDLPTFRADEVSKHDTNGSFWVTYKHGVYDITKFLPSHPGGEQILNAGGLSVEPFWNVYGNHKTEEVFELLETFRIGNLHDDDVVDHSDEELWAKEPARDARLLVRTRRPFNAETPPQHQIAHFDTPK